jgi:hypothetical protein
LLVYEERLGVLFERFFVVFVDIVVEALKAHLELLEVTDIDSSQTQPVGRQNVVFVVQSLFSLYFLKLLGPTEHFPDERIFFNFLEIPLIIELNLGHANLGQVRLLHDLKLGGHERLPNAKVKEGSFVVLL